MSRTIVQPRTIVVFSPCLSGGGAEKVAILLANSWIAKGYDVTICLRSLNNDYSRLLSQSVQTRVIRGPFPLASLGVLLYLIRTRPDFVLSIIRESTVLLIPSVFLFRLFSLPTKFFAREASPPVQSLSTYPLIRRVLVTYLLRFVYPLFTKIICNSPATLSSSAIAYCLHCSSLTVIPNPAYIDSSVQLSLDRIDSRVLTALSNHQPIILAVGRLVPVKNFPFLIQVFSDLLQSIPNIFLVIVGSGPLKDQLYQLAKDLDLSQSSFAIVDFTDNIQSYYSVTDIFVHTSLYEGFGNVLVEALSFGLPVCASDSDGSPSWILGSGKYGRLSPPFDGQQLKKDIFHFLSFPLTPISKRILQNYAATFSPHLVSEEYLKLFHEA